MNQVWMNKIDYSPVTIFLAVIGAIQPISYDRMKLSSAYMRFWHPISWIMVLITMVVCVFCDASIQECIREAMKPKGDDWKKVSIWKDS